ncbi:peptidase S26 [Nitratireductor aquibiodomus RA22]|uniref:Peptidase S26 n=1 Tax=Nitratireductor aquibiodomus RA22 TaxID=1189611 RepID=I5BRN4_9HYPH|nr:peptidase S26 [Nitratireductor aquibiodomus RA22]
MGEARDRDRLDRALPVWSGCRIVADDELFLMNWQIPDSLDGRYFGPLPATTVIGRAVPLYTDEDGDGRFVWRAPTHTFPQSRRIKNRRSSCPKSDNSRARKVATAVACARCPSTAHSPSSRPRMPTARTRQPTAFILATRPAPKWAPAGNIPAIAPARSSPSSSMIQPLRFRCAPGCSSRTRTDATGACTGPVRRNAKNRTDRCLPSVRQQHCGSAVPAAALPSFSFPASSSLRSTPVAPLRSRRPPDDRKSAIPLPRILPKRRSGSAFPSTGSSRS